MPRAGRRPCKPVTAVLDRDRFFDPDPTVRRVARELYEETRPLPIVSPHGHVDPQILARDEPFPEPAALIVQPDHYILRLLNAHGVSLERSEEHTSELQSPCNLVCRLLLEKKKK